MSDSTKWWENCEISQSDVVFVANIYNDIVNSYYPFQYSLKLTPGFQKNPWYKDLVNLIRTMNFLGVKPRDYIWIQLSQYKKPISKARSVPSIKMMASPSGIERYKFYYEKNNKIVPAIKKLTEEDFFSFSRKQMISIMRANRINSEEDFFKDPFLFSQLSRKFVENHKDFIKLKESGYYKQIFNVEIKDLFGE